MNIPVLAYHKVDKHFEWGINTVPPHLFEQHIKFLSRGGFKSILLSDLVLNRAKVNKPVVITFDDAYKSILEYAYPILDKYGFKATIFVISNYIGKKNKWDINLGGKTDRHLSWSEIQYLANSGWEIGSHTVSHPDLTKLTTNELFFELKSSKDHLENKLNIRVDSISYPYNRFNNSVLKYVDRVGYKAGCCLANKKSIQREWRQFAIPRHGVYFIDNGFWFRLKLQTSYFSKIEDIKQKIICFCSTGSIYYNSIKNHKKNVAN
jgi:peptidoglycan/xylan/chitin deacetylase (PgdA/CDA1 family)